MRRRRYIFVSRGLVPRSGSYPRCDAPHQPFPGGDLCTHKGVTDSILAVRDPLRGTKNTSAATFGSTRSAAAPEG